MSNKFVNLSTGLKKYERFFFGGGEREFGQLCQILEKYGTDFKLL